MHDELCAAIRYHHRQRVYAMEQRKRATLALGSFLRMVLGWSLALPKAEQEAIRAKAQALIAIGETAAKGKASLFVDDPDYREWEGLIAASISARQPFDQIEAVALKQMGKLATQLPAWTEWGKGVRGFGEASLAVIVSEAGDLSMYPKKGHLWKRMGLALVDGVRQGGLAKNAPKADWIAHGYNPERRSRMWNIGDTLIKPQGPYRDVYLARCAYEHARATEAGLLVVASTAEVIETWAKRGLVAVKSPRGVDPAAVIGAGHLHRRAQRYMEKRLLRDLWQVWNGRGATDDMPHLEAIVFVPPVHPVEREAKRHVPSEAIQRSPPAHALLATDALR